jgi:hypothetical protein
MRLIFFTCHEDLSEVQVFLKSFAFWLRDLRRERGEEDTGSGALPGELYLDPTRESYRFFGLTNGIREAQRWRIFGSIMLTVCPGGSTLSHCRNLTLPLSPSKFPLRFVQPSFVHTFARALHSTKQLNHVDDTPCYNAPLIALKPAIIFAQHSTCSIHIMENSLDHVSGHEAVQQYCGTHDTTFGENTGRTDHAQRIFQCTSRALGLLLWKTEECCTGWVHHDIDISCHLANLDSKSING